MAAPVKIQSLLGPIVALTTWTLVMEAWMYALRLPAVARYNVSIDPDKIKADIAAKIPLHLEYAAHNFNRLMEQPTQFYATVLVLSALGVHDRTTVALAYAYVGLRVAHSLVQVTSNHIMTGFRVFVASSVVLAAMTAKAASAIWG